MRHHTLAISLNHMVAAFLSAWGTDTGGNYNRSGCDPPPSYLSKLAGGGSGRGGGGFSGRVGGGGIGSPRGGPKGGGAARDPLLPHAYLKGVCVSGGMGV